MANLEATLARNSFLRPKGPFLTPVARELDSCVVRAFTARRRNSKVDRRHFPMSQLVIQSNMVRKHAAIGREGQLGKNAVQFRVLRDGTIPKNFLKLVYSSGKKDLDEASSQAVRKAAPFSHLPETYSQPFIELRMTFFYNCNVALQAAVNA